MKSLSLNLNTEAKSGSAGSDVVVSEAVGVRVGVASCCRGLKKRVVVSIKEAILLSVGDGLLRFRSLLVKLEEIEELYVGPPEFCVSRIGVTVT
ncbi:hypothetical protein Tco_1435827 [Tanacetum coccineum]